MLYGLFSLQTNLCISLHYQSDILWHTGSNYKQLLFSSDIWAGTSAMGICAFFYMWHWFGVVMFKRCMVDYWGANDIVTMREREALCAYVKWWKWWNSTGPRYEIPYFSMHMLFWFGVAALQRCMVDWQGVHLPEVYVYAYFYIGYPECGVGALQRSMVYWRQSICLGYMGIWSVSAFLHRLSWFGVAVLQRSMVNWWGAICLRYLCIHIST